jgi:integrase
VSGPAWQGPEPTDGYIFRREDGRAVVGPWLTGTWNRLARRMHEELDLLVIRLHDLRHTSITALVPSTDLETLRRRAGHSSIAITATYMHGVDEAQRRAGGAIGALFDEATPDATRDA